MFSSRESLYSRRMLTTLDFDKYITCNMEDCLLEYGITFGSNHKKILFVKAGQDCSARGYRNKYLKLAHEIREEYGMSVICSSNPDTEINQMDHAMQILSKEGLLATDAQIYFAGFSKGASIGCLQGANYPQITRYLLVNLPIIINTLKICRAAKNFSGEKMSFVFGSEDPSANSLGLLRLHERENMNVRIIPGQDHYLSRDNFDLADLVKRELLW